VAVPPVPSPLPDPAEHLWPAGTTIFRVFDHGFGSAQYNGTDVKRRFRPVYDGGTIVPTIYGSNAPDGAICETVFHDLDLKTRHPAILRATLLTQLLAPVVSARDLRLAALTDPEIRRLRVTHADLIETDASEYPATAEWGQAIYDHPARFDGIVWHSRQHHSTLSITLWESRAGTLKAGTAAVPEMLYAGRGYARVLALANAMDVTVIV
jgi:hypothetical protein